MHRVEDLFRVGGRLRNCSSGPSEARPRALARGNFWGSEGAEKGAPKGNNAQRKLATFAKTRSFFLVLIFFSVFRVDALHFILKDKSQMMALQAAHVQKRSNLELQPN